mmetsp:Transcript_26173/g.84718  ORF Transcript_26173/g.84718 Transcript_26173/m.84718 type:complete len:235 (+) Transcript_26173:475-1179(+)
MYRPHGPPLPVDEQLHRRQQPEALHALPLLHHRRVRLQPGAGHLQLPAGRLLPDVGGERHGRRPPRRLRRDPHVRLDDDVQPDLRHRHRHRHHRPHAKTGTKGQLRTRPLGRRLRRRPVAYVPPANGRQISRLPPSHGLQGRHLGNRPQPRTNQRRQREHPRRVVGWWWGNQGRSRRLLCCLSLNKTYDLLASLLENPSFSSLLFLHPTQDGRTDRRTPPIAPLFFLSFLFSFL